MGFSSFLDDIAPGDHPQMLPAAHVPQRLRHLPGEKFPQQSPAQPGDAEWSAEERRTVGPQPDHVTQIPSQHLSSRHEAVAHMCALWLAPP